eukprot:6201693-Pleurochrysis_carterae.AAC.3
MNEFTISYGVDGALLAECMDFAQIRLPAEVSVQSAQQPCSLFVHRTAATLEQVLFVDVDFVPLPLDVAYQELSSPTVQSTDLFRPEVTPEQVVVVLPAFEWVPSYGDEYVDPLTVNKSMLRQLVRCCTR